MRPTVLRLCSAIASDRFLPQQPYLEKRIRVGFLPRLLRDALLAANARERLA